MSESSDRRQFLQRTASFGAALALTESLGAREARAASDTMTVAIIGTNNRGSQLVPAFAKAAGVEIAYICDPEEGALAKGMQTVAKHQEKTPRAVRDFRQTLDDPALDAVVIATPDHWHAPAAILACAAGKHVYVEKPASHNGREGELLVAAARKHKRVVQLGTQRRSSPDIKAAIERVRAGELGRVFLARGWGAGPRPSIGHGKPIEVPSTLDFDLWQGPAPARPYVDNLVHYNWHWFWNWGTGEVGNNGIHALDLCRWGLAVDYPKRITSGGGKYSFDDDQQTPDTLFCTFDYDDKSIAWEHRTWTRRGVEDETFGVAFYGDEGTLVIGSQITLLDPKGKQLEQTPAKFSNEAHVGNFFDAIRTGAPLNAEIAEGVKSTDLCHLSNIAYRTGRTVNFDPAAVRIVGDEEAARLWSREYRAGWEPKV